MRWYKIEVGGRTFDATNNPNALNVELDITVVDADAGPVAATVVIWGIALQDISQAQDFTNKPITVSGGMQQGLPLATLQSAYQGVLTKGYVFQSFANWVGTEMWLTFVIMPGDPPAQTPAPNAPNPPPKNIVLNWLKGKPLSDALKQALQTGYPGAQIDINISSQLVAPQDNIGYYPNLKDLNNYLRKVSQQIMTGNNTYPGVGCCFHQGQITVHDGTGPPGPKMLQFTDLVGQPTWIEPNTIQIKSVMRADIKKAGDQIKLPPTRVVTTAEAQSGILGPLTFQGTFTVSSIRHVGNYRAPDGAAWVTVIEALKGSS